MQILSHIRNVTIEHVFPMQPRLPLPCTLMFDYTPYSYVSYPDTALSCYR
jgi:hypothetical protein